MATRTASNSGIGSFVSPVIWFCGGYFVLNMLLKGMLGSDLLSVVHRILVLAGLG